MKLSYRIKLYVFGLLIGLGMVFALFRDRFTPQSDLQAVLEQLEQDDVEFEPSALDSLEAYDVPKDSLLPLFSRGRVILPKRDDEGEKQHTYHILFRIPGSVSDSLSVKLVVAKPTRTEVRMIEKAGE